MESLVNGFLGVERESGIDLSGDLAGDNLKNLAAELDEEVVESRVDLSVNGTTLGLGLLDSSVEESGILGLLGGGENQGGVGGGILGLVLGNGWKRCEYCIQKEGGGVVVVVRGRRNRG